MGALVMRYDFHMSTDTPPESPESSESADENPLAQLGKNQSLVAEFWTFIKHNKLWWMTPIVIVLLAMVGFILFAESAPVLPYIYAL